MTLPSVVCLLSPPPNSICYISTHLFWGPWEHTESISKAGSDKIRFMVYSIHCLLRRDCGKPGLNRLLVAPWSNPGERWGRPAQESRQLGWKEVFWSKTVHEGRAAGLGIDSAWKGVSGRDVKDDSPVSPFVVGEVVMLLSASGTYWSEPRSSGRVKCDVLGRVWEKPRANMWIHCPKTDQLP